ncbi:histidine phosphatase family protein [Streptomyces sp. enrichment culture]|uniref:histidine phosphatase family protein n=1 Tax=Streptomyces sp. enrichment culture TaxID=1795815 RepID=UPI003F54F8C5
MTERAAAGPLRRLVVPRHAESARPKDVTDHERPPTTSARRPRAPADHEGPPAARAAGTPPPVRLGPRLHHADVPGLPDVMREAPAEVETLPLVGRNPGPEDLVPALASDGLDDTADRVRVTFPTSAITVLDRRGVLWRDLVPAGALLTSLTVPRGRR